MGKAAAKVSTPSKASKKTDSTSVAAKESSSGDGIVYLEFQDGSSNKFYEMTTAKDGLSVTIRFGRIGDAGTQQKKEFASADASQAFIDKTVKEKSKKGYASAAAASSSARAVPITRAPAAADAMQTDTDKPAVAKAAKKAKKPDASVAPEGASRDSNVYLEFQDGSSNKFYEMTTAKDGLSVTIRFGRIGDAGTQQKKEFASADASQAFIDKTVKEKSKKGYASAAAASSSARAVPITRAPGAAASGEKN